MSDQPAIIDFSLPMRVQIEGLTDSELKTLFECVAAERSLRLKPTVPKPKLLRSFDEYQDTLIEARAEGHELPPLTRELAANGRQFRLTDAQLDVLEASHGKLAHREVTLYNVSWNATDDQLAEFSLQVCLPSNARRRSGATVACVIRDAPKFFDRCAEKQRELDEVVSDKPDQPNQPSKKRSKRKAKTPSMTADDILTQLGIRL